MSSVDKIEQKSISDMISYIKHHIHDMTIQEKKKILQIIMASDIDHEKIHTKGGGTQVSFKHIDNNTITGVYSYVYKMILVKQEQLMNLKTN